MQGSAVASEPSCRGDSRMSFGTSKAGWCGEPRGVSRRSRLRLSVLGPAAERCSRGSWRGSRLQRRWVRDGWGNSWAWTPALGPTAHSSLPCLSSCLVLLKRTGAPPVTVSSAHQCSSARHEPMSERKSLISYMKQTSVKTSAATFCLSVLSNCRFPTSRHIFTFLCNIKLISMRAVQLLATLYSQHNS